MFPNKLINPESPVINALGVPSDLIDNTSLAIITGNNASGKSLLRKYISMRCEQVKIKKFHFSQQGRSAGGFERAMIYSGSESEDSTGQISVSVVIRAFKQIQNNKEPLIVVFDEPEIGLSEESQLGLAIYMKEQLKIAPESLLGTIVITHSRYFVGVLKDLPHKFFCFGEKYLAESWLNRGINPTDPQEIVERSHKQYQHFSQFLRN